MKYLYGKDIFLEFRPVDSRGSPVLVAADSPTIYVYRDRPSLDQARNGTGTSQQGSTITSWVPTPDGLGKIVAIPAISDYDPNSSTDSWSYWVCVNYKLKDTSGQTQTKIIEIWLSRALAHTSTVGTTNQDIKDVYPAISEYLTNEEIDKQIASAVEELKIELKGEGVNWAQLQELRDYKLVLAYKVLELAAISQYRQPGDKWDLIRTTYAARAGKLIPKIKLPYDSDRDGEVDRVEKAKNYSIPLR